jgi:hypothetical protein
VGNSRNWEDAHTCFVVVGIIIKFLAIIFFIYTVIVAVVVAIKTLVVVIAVGGNINNYINRFTFAKLVTSGNSYRFLSGKQW